MTETEAAASPAMKKGGLYLQTKRRWQRLVFMTKVQRSQSEKKLLAKSPTKLTGQDG
jgi:hypothetical protein